MENIKWFLYTVVISIVTFFLYTYICNVNIYKEVSEVRISNNDVLKSFDIDENKYNGTLNTHIEGVGDNKLNKNRISHQRFRNLKIDIKEYCIKNIQRNVINKIKKENKKNFHRKITFLMYCNNDFKQFIEKLCIRQFNINGKIDDVIDNIYDKAKYFPVAELESNKGSYPFSNSWNGARNYGGKRKHEGTDIMYTENKENVVPIVSISDGVIEKKGWLELGGYRLLIRANENVKFYYAHLSSYAKGIKEGDKIKAGQLLGYMGSTGYGKEGTKGKFDVHLHFGMYYKDGEKEIGINPYFLLKMLNFSKLYYK